jgi:hypothetical protein
MIQHQVKAVDGAIKSLIILRDEMRDNIKFHDSVQSMIDCIDEQHAALMDRLRGKQQTEDNGCSVGINKFAEIGDRLDKLQIQVDNCQRLAESTRCIIENLLHRLQNL